MTWVLSEAKDRLEEVVNLALTEGTQTITWRDDAVVVVSAASYAELSEDRRAFEDFLMSGPSFEGPDLLRDKSPIRDVEINTWHDSQQNEL